MTVHAAVAISPEDFVLGRALAAARDARVELEPVVLLSDSTLAPFVRVVSDDPDRLTDRIRAEANVEEVAVLERGPEEHLLRVRWTGEGNDLIRALGDADAACVEGVATDATWHLSLRFPTHERLAEWYHRCRDLGVGVTVERVGDAEALDGPGGASSITECQRETLRVALEAGYFSVPREVTLAELAERLGVSDTAASQRLRRGIRNVLVETVGTETH